MNHFKAITTLCVLLSSCILQGIYAACNSTLSVEFVEIAQENWDRSYSDISVDGKRPLGFQKGTVYFNSPDQPNPCIRITGTNTRHISILVEVPSGLSIRLKDQANLDESIPKQYNKCPLAAANTMFYEFYLDPGAGSSESDVSFWYKFTKGPDSATDPEGYWCGEVNTDLPSSLVGFPTGFVPGQTTKDPVGGTNTIFTSYICITVCFLALLLADLITSE